MRLGPALLTAAAATIALGLGAAPAAAEDTQPANLGNVANVDRGASAPGPHCHFVLKGGGASGFDGIVTGAAHQGHTNTSGVFAATACP